MNCQTLGSSGVYKLASIWDRFGDVKSCFQVLKFNDLVSVRFLKALHPGGNLTFRASPFTPTCQRLSKNG